MTSLKPSRNGKGSGCREPSCPLKDTCKPQSECTLCTLRDCGVACEEMTQQARDDRELTDSQLSRVQQMHEDYKPITS